ncbi:hypothetical protein ACJMK2_026197 [Sinanodonta woodiana]|uniref:Ig-like domain-containing protein n=1 Tax=Sinanodonta woodiana TaxID=1069815 RepID=A0ABD3XL48_SINWO
MKYIYVAVFILVLFNAKKSAKCDSEDIIAMAGCNISLTWMVPSTRKDPISVSIGNSYERPLASLSFNTTCDVKENSSMLCNINNTENGTVVVLNIFNVTARQSGNYTIWTKTIVPKQSTNVFKKIVVIGKPTIMEGRKPIVGLPFQMICNTTYEQEEYVYRWRINGIERTTVVNVNSHNISILDMKNNFSNVTCQVCFNEKGSNISSIPSDNDDCSSVTCDNDGCSIESDPYTIKVQYGPDNVSLSREERHFYLKEHDVFAIDCFANCYPDCIFWWKGPDSIQSQKLSIIFELRMSGQYACHVNNQHTNITLISEPITLHHIIEAFHDVGLVGVAVVLVVIGMLLGRKWSKHSSSKIDSGRLSQVQDTETEVSQTELERNNRHLHMPSNKGRECKSTIRLECPNKSPEDNFRPKFQEDPYNTINDDALSDDDLRMDLVIHKHSQESRRNTEHIHYDYAYSIGICHVETDFTHVADETSIIPGNDFSCPVELFQDKINYMPDPDHAYLTVIDDSSHSMEVKHSMEVDDTVDNDVDKTNIIPLNG